jgi:hypothetical protein
MYLYIAQATRQSWRKVCGSVSLQGSYDAWNKLFRMTYAVQHALMSRDGKH